MMETLQCATDSRRFIIFSPTMEMKVRVWLALAVVLGLALDPAEGAKILGIFPTHTPSHYVMYGSLMRAMAARGHEVTVVSPFPSKTPMENFVDISLDGTMPSFLNNISIDVPLAMSPIDNHFDNIYDGIESCEIAMNHPEVMALLDPEHSFDLFVTEIFCSECFLAYAHKMGIPTVGLVSSVSLPWVNDMVANPDNPAYVPLYFYPTTQRMNFWQRLYNTIMSIIIKASYEMIANWRAQKISEDILGSIPPISSLAKNYSMILINSHFSINQVRPWVPQVVEVGGLHIKEIKKLPTEIQTFLDESTDGAIYFSFGSMVRIDSIPEEKLKQIIQVLGSLKQRVLWKVDGTKLPEIPPNIKTGLWMPQRDILCHPNTKVFISHGGLLGTQEAIACGVPILGVPLFADQSLNLAELDDRKVVQILNYYDINTKTLTRALDKLINDTSYKQNMEHLSNLFLDRPQHPLDTATYWLEYVIKYKGAKHLRSAALDLAWYQYLLLDVLVFILASIVASIYILKYVMKKILPKNIQAHKKLNGSVLANGKALTNGALKHLNGNIHSHNKNPNHSNITAYAIYLLYRIAKRFTIFADVDHSKIE